MSLETLPVELIELVADNLVSIGDLSTLSRTSRRLHLVVDHRLYARDAKHGRKALKWSTRSGSCSVLEKTIQHGADVNKRWDFPIPLYEPLTLASGNRQVEIVKLLLEHGADPNPSYSRGSVETPLSVAARSGSYEVVKTLLEAGADIHATTIYKEPEPAPLYRAVTCGQNDDVVRLLLENGALKDMPQHCGVSALEGAIMFGTLSTVKLLLQAGVSPICRDFSGRTPPMLAMVEESEDIALFLLEIGAGLDLRDTEGKGLMWYAASHGHENVVKYLLDRGCSPDDDNWPPLTAAVLGKDAIVRLLLDASARIEQQDEQGKTPLRIAYEDGDIDMMKLLLERGASLRGAGLDESNTVEPDI